MNQVQREKGWTAICRAYAASGMTGKAFCESRGIARSTLGYPRMAMGSTLMGIGKRSAVLNEAALTVARDVGPIEFTSANGECDAFDVVKHLTTDRLQRKLEI